LSFKETRELEEQPQKIAEMEKTKSQLLELLNSPDLYNTNNLARVLDVNKQLEELEAALAVAYDRWDELEELAVSFGNCK
jgi:hypothetical protein